MSESLPVLERKRTAVLEKMTALGDLRPGSLTTTQGKCGKAECCCKQPEHPGHGPHWRITYKVDGKTRSESLYEEAAIKKAEREIEEFRRFQQLSREFVDLSTQICRARGVEAEERQEKKRRKPSARK
jgi:Family of unknown function (DUF6788)